MNRLAIITGACAVTAALLGCNQAAKSEPDVIRATGKRVYFPRKLCADVAPRFDNPRRIGLRQFRAVDGQMVSNRQSESTPIEFYELQFETALFCRMDGVDGLVLVDCDVLHGGFTGPKGELESWWGPSTCVDRFSGERPRMMRVPFDKVIRQYVLALSSLEEKQLGWRYFVVSPEVMEKAVREKSLLVIPDMPSLPRVEDDHEIAAMLALAIKTDEETQARINREAQSQGL